MTAPHTPVLIDEVIAALSPASGETHVDGTYGAGGYSAAILSQGDKGALLADFAREGFAYQKYFEPEHGDYGVAVTSPEWLMRTLQRYPDIIMRAYLEEAWGMQDVVILYKKAGHYEPILGVPEQNATAAASAKTAPGLLGRLFGK